MTPKRFALLGDPVAHSKSPKMHGAAYRALGLPHTYEALHTPAEQIGDRIASLRDRVDDRIAQHAICTGIDRTARIGHREERRYERAAFGLGQIDECAHGSGRSARDFKRVASEGRAARVTSAESCERRGNRRKGVRFVIQAGDDDFHGGDCMRFASAIARMV